MSPREVYFGDKKHKNLEKVKETELGKRINDRRKELGMTKSELETLVMTNKITFNEYADLFLEEIEDIENVNEELFLNLSIALNLSKEYILKGGELEHLENKEEAVAKLIQTQINSKYVLDYAHIIRKIESPKGTGNELDFFFLISKDFANLVRKRRFASKRRSFSID